MTEKLYWNDSYMKEFDAEVVSAEGSEVVLDKTAFYPTGGGQPNDTGILEINGKQYSIVDVKKDGDKIIHVASESVAASAGDKVKGKIDWQRRYMLMRYHTAIHLIDAVVEKYYKSGMLTGGQIYVDRARVDFDMQDLNREKAEEIIGKANEVAKEGHDVVSREISASEASKVPRLARTEPGNELLQNLEKVRVVEIVGLDAQADGGTHVRNTKEIGTITLSNYENKGKHSKRVEIKLS